MSHQKVNLAELERAELEEALERLEVPTFHGRQVFAWIHARGVTRFEDMTDLSRPLRDRLAEAFVIATPRLVSTRTSTDGTTKIVVGFDDGRQVESVYIPDTPAQTFCISTQVGCAMACAFCLTGKMGLVRNLTAGEITGQVQLLARQTGLVDRTFNIVLMGMGEPLHNYDATMKALRILADERGLGVHPKRVTLSTVGLVPALERLATEPLMPNLAISLHATTDASRTALVPLNKRYDLGALLDACRRFPVSRRARITFEYVLLAGVNDTPDDARRLVKLLNGIRGKVNAFVRILADRGIRVSVRKSRGRDIRAACGQLIVEGGRASAAQELAARLKN